MIEIYFFNFIFINYCFIFHRINIFVTSIQFYLRQVCACTTNQKHLDKSRYLKNFEKKLVNKKNTVSYRFINKKTVIIFQLNILWHPDSL